MAEPYIGEIRMFSGPFAPRNWHFCDGTLLDIHQYTALFSLLQTTYGGDGGTKFALPDLRGRLPVGTGRGPGLTHERRLGEQGGHEEQTLEVKHLPPHTHGVKAIWAHAEDPMHDNFFAATPMIQYQSIYIYGERQNLTTLASGTVKERSWGDPEPVNNMQPSLAINYIICVDGIYPPRS